MSYQPVSLSELPRHHAYLQDLAATPLKQTELSRKYGLVFEEMHDNISLSEVSTVKVAGNYFLIVCRAELPEWEVVIRTASSPEPIETYVPRMLAQFVEAINFDARDIDHIWPFTKPAK